MNAAQSLKDKVKRMADTSAAKRASKRALRAPTDLDFAIASRIGLLDASLWDAAARDGGLFLSREYLAMLEGATPANLSPRYALVTARGNGAIVPVAAIHMQIAELSAAQLRQRRLDHGGRGRLLDPLKQSLSDKIHQRLLACGNFLTYGQHGVAIGEGIDPAAAWHAVAEVLYRVRNAEKLDGGTQFSLIKDVCGEHVAAARTLENLSYRWIETEPNMVLTLDPAWKSHEDYLASLASKYRSSVRNAVMKPIEAAGCIVESLTDPAPHVERLHALYKNVQENAAVRPFELPPDYFPALLAFAGARGRVSVLRRNADEAILGFLVSLADGDTGYAYHIGFDRQTASDLPVYLRLLHAGIADGIALGVRRISFGRTALEPKAALGAKPEAFGVLVRHRQPVLNKLIKPLLMGIEHDAPPDRNPFKKS
ncbi:MAG: GNAT family N-acetyltransferase [Betaproteobacteria bacterium]|nr:GNAT family N-acetyltransferase [Betaproteobacteria bacterium]